jgi:hypothetical protein
MENYTNPPEPPQKGRFDFLPLHPPRPSGRNPTALRTSQFLIRFLPASPNAHSKICFFFYNMV